MSDRAQGRKGTGASSQTTFWMTQAFLLGCCVTSVLHQFHGSLKFGVTLESYDVPRRARSEERQLPIQLPDWMSNDTMLLPQELRQWAWEQNHRYERSLHPHLSDAAVRSEFHRDILAVAENATNRALMSESLRRLEEYVNETKIPNTKEELEQARLELYNDILPAVALDEDFLVYGRGRAGQRNNVLGGERLLKRLNGSCVVYGAGIDYETNVFEAQVARDYGCAVHALDCTMTDKRKLEKYLKGHEDITNMAYHRWCVGQEEESSSSSTSSVKGVYDFSAIAKSIFTLDTIMERLGHSELEIFKFDIEGRDVWQEIFEVVERSLFCFTGFEWQLLDVLLAGKNLPQQIHFELHAVGSNRHYVPQFLTKDKGRDEVVALFRRLYKAGYRVVTKEINHGDASCAEFVLYRFYDGRKS